MSTPAASPVDTGPRFGFGRTVTGFCALREHVWPDQCVCCNGPAEGTRKEAFILDLRPFIAAFGKEVAALFVRRLATGVRGIELGTVDKEVFVDVRLPYRRRCREHESLAQASMVCGGIGLSVVVLAILVIAVVWLLTRRAHGGSGFPSLAVFSVAALISVVLVAVAYALRVTGNTKRSETCAPIGRPITLEPSKGLLAVGDSLFGWIHFGNAEYGEAFERANGLGSAAASTGPDLKSAVAGAVPEQEAGSAELFFNVGKASFQAGRWDEARLALEQAVSRAPGSAAARFLLGASLAELGRPEAALPHLERSVEIDATNADASHTLGMVLGRLGRSAEADRHLARAAWLGHPQARETLAAMGLAWCARCGALLPSPGAPCPVCRQET